MAEQMQEIMVDGYYYFSPEEYKDIKYWSWSERKKKPTVNPAPATEASSFSEADYHMDEMYDSAFDLDEDLDDNRGIDFMGFHANKCN